MPKIITNTRKKQPSPLERFIGEGATLQACEDILVNEAIQASCTEVYYTDDNMQEEHAMLYLFPIEDNKFCVQLCYLVERHGQNPIIYSIIYTPKFFELFSPTLILKAQPFLKGVSTELEFTICTKAMQLLADLAHQGLFSGFELSLHRTQVTTGLLVRSLESIDAPFSACQVPACRFLAYESERTKIQEACTIIDNQDGKPYTIPELARKVAMNECYLKKGFKALTGKTIHEYQQEVRINKAKELLKLQSLSVTDVAITLGYSSISHFSTAFKRVTGMKPCELLS